MPSWIEQTAKIDALSVGRSYSKRLAAEMMGVPVPAGSRDWGGLVRFSNAVAFFITLEKGANRYAKEHRYNDRFDGDLLYWESRASHDKASSQVRILRDSDTAIIGFARVGEKVGNQTQAFSYLGVLRFVDWWGAKPVHFTWRLEAFPNGLDGSLQLKALAKWRPIQDESAKGTTEPRSERRRPNRSSGTTTARTEGATVRVVSNRYERDPRARQECLTFHGCVCFVCGFEFRAMYGDLGSGFTFVHHRIPIASRARMGEYELDPRRDLVPICGNCHAMVHRRQPADGPDGPPPQLPAEQSARLSELRRLALDDESTD